MTILMPSANPLTSLGVTSQPSRSWSTISGSPPVLKPTTGVPLAMASIATNEKNRSVRNKYISAVE